MSILSSLGSIFTSTKDRNQDFIMTKYGEWQDYSYLTSEKDYFKHYVGWAWKAVDTLSNGIVDHDPVLMDYSGKEPTVVEAKDSTLLSDLHHFNTYQTYDDGRMLTLAHMLLTGLGFWYIKKSKTPGHIYDFYILNPEKVRMKTDKTLGLPLGYWYQQPNGSEIFLEEQDVIVFRTLNPEDWLKGHSTLDATSYQQIIWEKMNSTILNLFGNEARMQGILSIENISPQEQKRIEAEMKRKYTGVHNTGKFAVANKNASWTPININPRELEYNQGLKIMREEILAMFGVPVELAMITSDSKYKNAEEAQRIFQKWSLLPKLRNEVSVFNEQLITKYFSGLNTRILNYKFEVDNPVTQDMAGDTEVATKQYTSGIATLNEAREKVNLPKVENGDKFANEINEDLFSQRIDNINANNSNNDEKSKTKDMWEDAGLGTREEAKAYFHKKSIENEYLLNDQTVKFFKAQGKRVLDDVTASKDINTNWDEEVETMVKHFIPTFETIAEQANKQAEIFLDVHKPVTKQTLSMIEKNVMIFAKEVTETTQKKLEAVFAKAQAEGLGLKDTKKAISEVYATWSDPIKSSRAEMIARTETTRTTNLVSKERYKGDGIQYKEWLSAKDGDVRADHVGADGDVVKMDEKFTVGSDKMDHPGDSSASAKNVVNCRCTLIPRIDNK